ncbi:hypothetical protein SCA03_46330 [Streptomyces cacaoi]|uniref:Uncharacterized protein n=1 Tax=Streptomyces cacaoi TaxID=1898 RepID=A0A4Y3R3F5_STRCI|nr:hypothetical protein SCA03_46330 [Streptomyces cacaoi]
MHAEQHPQQGRRSGERQGDDRQPGPGGGEAAGQRGADGGVVAGEGPVAGRRAVRDGVGARHRAARALLVDDELERLAPGVGEHHAEAGEYGPAERGGVPGPQRRPQLPQQQQAEQQQGALGGGFHEGREQSGSLGRRPAHAQIQLGGRAAGDPHGVRCARAARRQHDGRGSGDGGGTDGTERGSCRSLHTPNLGVLRAWW